MELKTGVPDAVVSGFSFDVAGRYLAAANRSWESLRVWNLDTRKVVASVDVARREGAGFASKDPPRSSYQVPGERINDLAFVAGGHVLAVAISQGNDYELRFYNLVHAGSPRVFHGRNTLTALAASPDGT